MKIHRLPSLALTLAACSVLAGCVAPIESRIRKNPDAFAQLSAKDQEAVRAGKIREGMDKSAVVIAWGEPERVSEGRKNGRKYERWHYVQLDAVITQPYGAPYGYYGPRHYDDSLYTARPVVNYIPREAAFVEFIDGRVTGWALPQQ